MSLFGGHRWNYDFFTNLTTPHSSRFAEFGAPPAAAGRPIHSLRSNFRLAGMAGLPTEGWRGVGKKIKTPLLPAGIGGVPCLWQGGVV